MKNKIIIAAVSVVAVVGVVSFLPEVAGASAAGEIGKGANNVDIGSPSLENAFEDIANMILFILGAIAVIMIIIGGVRYTTSNGDSTQIKGAKDTILYAVIGLVVAILAYAIVNFVVDAF